MTTDPDRPIPDLVRLPTEADPPPAVRQQVVARLRRDGLIQGTNRARPVGWRWPALAAAAVILAFAGGWFLGRGAQPRVSASPGQYALLLYGEPDQSTGIDRVREYTDWARTVASSGRGVTGEKLGSESALVGRTRTDLAGPSLPGGFFIIDAASFAEAVEFARAHPHARDGGTIVVRAVDATGSRSK